MTDMMNKCVIAAASPREIADLQIRATAIYADNCDSPLWDKILAPMRPYVQGAK